MKRIQIKKKSHTIVALLNYYKNRSEYRLWLHYENDKLSIFDNTIDNPTHIDMTCVINQYGKLVYWDNNRVRPLTYKRLVKIIKTCARNAQIDIINHYENTIKDFYDALTKYALQRIVVYDTDDNKYYNFTLNEILNTLFN